MTGTIPIEVDGRVSLEHMSELIARGADILVSGSTGIFMKKNTLETNYNMVLKAIKKGLELRNA